MNVQVVGGLDRLIYDVDFRCPGSYHDSRVWSFSEVKTVLENRFPRYFVAGDQGYPRSPILITPYSANEVDMDPSKKLFNIR